MHVVLLVRMFVLKDSLCPPHIIKPLTAPHKENWRYLGNNSVQFFT